jgi:AraC family L-rhamnose operon transcriptional activator RhaR
MALILSRDDYFPATTLPVAVAERMPQPSFPPHRHEFSEIVIVWRGNGLHVLNDRPWLITCGDVFYIRDSDCHSYDSVNDLVLDNILYCRDRFGLALDWNQLLPQQGPDAPGGWRLTTRGMALARGVISQLERESSALGGAVFTAGADSAPPRLRGRPPLGVAGGGTARSADVSVTGCDCPPL